MGINTMPFMYHFLSMENWQSVKVEKVLRPESNPRREELPARQQKIVLHEKHLVGIPQGKLLKWKQYGNWDYLCDFVAFHLGFNTGWAKKIVQLKVPILETEGALVREHKYISPRYMNRLVPGLSSELDEMYRSSGMSMVPEKMWKQYVGFLNNYLASTMPLNQYHDEFEVPELWLPQDTPIDNLEATILRIPKASWKR